MSRLPFDPDHAPGAAAAPRPAEARPLTVAEVAQLITAALESVTAPIRVIGQISNLKRPGHWYFSLKDENAVLGCVAWASAARAFRFAPEEGDEVVAVGRLGYYAPQGRTQFYVDRLEPVGAGALELKFRALCEELRGLGYFAEAGKIPPPVFPRRIAVITSADGAAVRDVISTAEQRCRAVGLLVVDVRVQGAGAAESVATAIRRVDRARDALGVDAILVTRGGGSIEDLWAFNERVVADAVHACHLPLVAAIGHESDTTIIELVADVRASTPTQAAMRLVPSAAELDRQRVHLQDRAVRTLERRLQRERERLRHQLQREPMRDPAAVVREGRERLEPLHREHVRLTLMRLTRERLRVERLTSSTAGLGRLQPQALLARRREPLALLAHRLERAMRARLDDRRRLDTLQRGLADASSRHLRSVRVRLAAAADRLAAVDPAGVLSRGYSITTDEAGSIVRSIEQVRSGQTLRSRVADGEIRSTVDGGRPAAPPGPEADRTASGGTAKHGAEPGGPGQLDLFRAPQ